MKLLYAQQCKFSKISSSTPKMHILQKAKNLSNFNPASNPADWVKCIHLKCCCVCISFKFSDFCNLLPWEISARHKCVLKTVEFWYFWKKMLFLKTEFVVLEISNGNKSLKITKFDNHTVFKILVNINSKNENSRWYHFLTLGVVYKL